MTKKAIIALLLLSTGLLRAEESPGRAFDWLTPDTLPPPREVVQAALDALPKTLAEKQDWLKRMRRAAWYPQLELQYRVGETAVRDYTVVDRVERTTSSETTRQSSRDSESRLTSSGGDSVETVRDGGGSVVESRESSTVRFDYENSTRDGSGSSRRSGSSVTYAGPDSYATGEKFKWADEFGVFLTWDLSRFVFQEGEINVARVEMDRETFRQNISTQVIQAYYDLMETLMLLDNPSYRDSIPTRVRKERLAFLLDTLTGGYLTSVKK